MEALALNHAWDWIVKQNELIACDHVTKLVPTSENGSEELCVTLTMEGYRS